MRLVNFLKSLSIALLVILIYINVVNMSGAKNPSGKAEAVVYSSSSKDIKNSNNTNVADNNWLQQVQLDISQKEYYIQEAGNQNYLQSPNRANGTRIIYYPSGIKIQPRIIEDSDKAQNNYSLAIVVNGYGTKEKLIHQFHASKIKKDKNEAFAFDNNMKVEYVNNQEGTRQNFIIHQPVSSNELAVHLTVNTSLTASQNKEESIQFDGNNSATRLYYSDLKVWDAKGTLLPAKMILEKESSGNSNNNDYSLLLAVNTTNAIFPVTVDPIVTNGNPSNSNSKLECNLDNAYFGWSVSGAGDVNGDGYSDVIVGAYQYENGNSVEGAAFIYHGSATGVSTSVSTQLEGNLDNAQFGYSVSEAGDVNGDGYGDVIVGAYAYENGNTEEGAVFIYHGSASGVSSTVALKIEANKNFANMGSSVSTAGDVNNDGYSDIIYGALNYENGNTQEGAVFVHLGTSGGVNATANFTREGNQDFAQLGTSVSAAGDVNRDNFGDIIFGAPGYTNGSTAEGAAFVYRGNASGINTNPTTVNTIECNSAGANLGYSVSGVGDTNADNYSDVIIGAPKYSNGNAEEGAAFEHLGGSSGISVTPAHTFESNQSYAHRGWSVSTAGDVNGDGFADAIIGAPEFDNGALTDQGNIIIVKGNASTGLTGVMSTIEGNQAIAAMGSSVSCAGDVNGDGYSDVICGAWYYDNGNTDEGSAFVYHGGGNTIGLTSAQTLESNQTPITYFGNALSCAGDVNGDGYDDIVVGAYQFDNGSGQTDEGAAFVYHGSSTGLSTTANSMLESNQASAYFGYTVTCAGDVNGDGFSDIIISCYSYANGQSGEGAAFIYHGSASGINTSPAAILETNLASARVTDIAGVGDVNGDGYSDVVFSTYLYNNGQSSEGAVWLHYGSSSGINLTPAAFYESNVANRQFGSACMGADVNGDGYSDVVIGVSGYSNGHSNEGAFFVYHGGTSTINFASPNMTYESNINSHSFGDRISCAGDVNGDGYNDILVTSAYYSNGQTNEGAIYIFHGSSSGVVNSPAGILESNQATIYMTANSSAGDVNGDGYSDIISGAMQYSNGQSGEGAIFICLGSSSGVNTSSPLIIESNLGSQYFGINISTAGDVNGDGYSDVIAGTQYYTNGQQYEGSVSLFYGNGGGASGQSRRNNIRTYNSDLATPIQQSNASSGTFGVGMFSTSFQGRQKIKLVWEIKQEGQPFSSGGGNISNSVSSTSSQGSFTSSGTAGLELKNAVSKSGLKSKVRMRVQFDLASSITGQKYGPWRYPQGYLTGQLGMGTVPVPVEWLSFTAQWLTTGESAQLNWSTASEKNNSHFTVLRSIDGQNWEEVAQVNGAGTTNIISNYTFIDNSLKHLNTSTHKHVYYRLMQTDYNGQFSFSEVRELTLEPQSDISVSPNPGSHQVINLKQPALSDLTYIIVDVQGRQVGSGIIPIGRMQCLVDLQHLPAGVYFLSIEQTGKKENIKLIRQ